MTQDLPRNWEAGIGNRSESHYTKFFYNPEKDLEMRVYWDKGEKHTVLVRTIEKRNGEVVNGYPEVSRKAESEKKAERKAETVMKKISNGEIHA